MKREKIKLTKNLVVIISALLLLVLILFVSFKLLSSTNANQTNQTNPAENLNSEISYISIIDGDTFEIVSGENSETIRLLCVDTPEKGKEGYVEAQNFLSSLISGKDLQIERHGLDNYNRTLAWVSVGDVLVNKEIIDLGLGLVFKYNNTNCSRVM